MAKNVYICGNPLVDYDSMPFRILEALKNTLPDIHFSDFDPTENFPDDNPLFIIDTVAGISDVRVIEDVDGFEDAPHFSLHDADLAFHLKLMKKTGKLPQVKIFGVPPAGDEEVILSEVVRQLKKSLLVDV